MAVRDHYKRLGIEPIDAIKAWMSKESFEGFLQGNVIKYIARWRLKGGLQDLYKARVYLGWLITQVEDRNDEPTPAVEPVRQDQGGQACGTDR